MDIQRVRGTLWRLRFLLLAVVAMAVIVTILQAIGQLRPETRLVVVTTGRILPGSTIEPDDLRLAEIPESMMPDDVATDISSVEGRVAVSALPRGMPVPHTSLLSQEFLAGAPPGSSIVSLTVDAEGTAALVEPGNTVALYPVPREYEDAPLAPVVREATVMGVGATPSDESFMNSSASVHTIYVAVPEDDVGAVLAANTSGIQVALLGGTG